jgi:hypothetical protein
MNLVKLFVVIKLLSNTLNIYVLKNNIKSKKYSLLLLIVLVVVVVVVVVEVIMLLVSNIKALRKTNVSLLFI